MSITVLEKPQCTQCTMTKRVLTSKGVPFEIGDATSDESLALAAEHGIASAPIVIATYPSGEKKVWGGFIPAFLDDYASAWHGEAAAA